MPTGVELAGALAEMKNFILPKNYPEIDFNLMNFHYHDKGSLATVGRYLAIADIGKFKFQGFFAWLLWSFVYIMSLIGVKNKLTVLVDWSWSYFTYAPSLRLMIKPSEKRKEKVNIKKNLIRRVFHYFCLLINYNEYFSGTHPLQTS